jgi:phosphoenolpyruvate-protein phosphotransferase (PTS system enzyme I)
MDVFTGKGVSHGIAFGIISVLQSANASVDESPAEDPEKEWAFFIKAKKQADEELAELFETTRREIGEKEAMIIDVQRMMLDDGDFNDAVSDLIHNGRKRAAAAAALAGKQFSEFFAGLDDPYMRARSADVADVSKRLVRLLTGGEQNQHEIHEPYVLLAEDLSPSETLQLDKSFLQAIVTKGGTENSHAVILARALNLPCVIQADLPDLNLCKNRYAAVDGDKGKLYLEPDEETAKRLHALQEKCRSDALKLEALRELPTVTKDGRKIRLFANIAGLDDLEQAVKYGAEGIGLFRSEFLYLGRDSYPSEEEQFEAYRKAAETMNGRMVIIRTADIGADKTAPYLQLPHEENPALGLRGIRLCFARPEIFKTQLRAIYRAAAFGSVSVMFPMIISRAELRRCREIAEEVRGELEREGKTIGRLQFGAMIETPAAALAAEELAHEVDFFSVGTNDLTQYTLAVDRQNPEVGQYCDTHHPALLKLLQFVVDAAHQAGIWAGICGELAADSALTKTFLQMGYDELSVAPSSLLKLRHNIRNINLSEK